VAAEIRGEEVIAAISGEHLWVVLEPSAAGEAHALVHHAMAETPWQYRQVHTMSQPPAMMAAWGNRLWMVQQARAHNAIAASTSPADTTVAGERTWQREVYSAAVVLNPATGLYYLEPIGRLEMAPSLPGLGRLAGFVASAQGPVALLVPSQRATVTISAGANSIAAEPFLDRALLLRLEPGKTSWTEIPLPAAFDGQHAATLAWVPGSEELVLLGASGETPDRTDRFALRPDGTWLHTTLPLELRFLRTSASVAGQLAAIIEQPGEEQVLAYVRQTGLLPLASLPRSNGPSALLGSRDRLMLVERQTGGAGPGITVRSIDPLTGEIGKAEPFEPQPVTAGRMWQMTLMIGLTFSAVLLVVMLRPAPAGAIPIDPAAVLPAGCRLLAGVVDFMVGGLPVMLLLDLSASQLMVLPVVTFEVSRCWPYLLAAGVATTIAALGEMLTGRSIGKALVGGQVTALNGQRPPTWRLLVRAAVRFVVLALPPLAAFALTNSHMQGLEDWAGRTLVLRSDWQALPPPVDHDE
jgi:hypothetical protein